MKQYTTIIMFRKILFFPAFCAILLTNVQCYSQSKISAQVRKNLVDKNASAQTVALYYNLKAIARNYTIFGQQDYASDGRGWKNLENRCDVKDVCGSYPAINCLDFLHFTNPVTSEKKDNSYLTRLMHQTYDRGGIISFCWHYYNPVTGGLFYDTTEVVKNILPGGSHHEAFKKSLAIIANFAHNAKGKNGELIPIIFRPWHEFDGNWFWWGKSHCTAQKFKELYRFTVIYLRDSLHVHNFLYAFSPDCKFHSEADYLQRYPGDEYVDILGMDNYWDFTPNGEGLKGVILKAGIITKYAQKKNKLAALTETGLANLPDTTWYTERLLKVIKDKNVRLAYVNVWRGEYVPYPGHPACKDFIKFRHDPVILFESDLPDMYLINNKLNIKKD